MSTTETPFPAQPPATPQPPRRPSRLRRFIVATALLLTGGLIGAVFTSSTHGFGPGWHHGPPGWSYYGGDGPRGWRDGGEFGSRFFLPGRIERGVERALWSVDASTEQRQKITTIFQRAADDLYALRAQHLDGRRQIRDALAAATVDRGKIETLRAEQIKLADTASKRLSDAVADAAEVLNPAQRAELARRIERWQRWHRG